MPNEQLLQMVLAREQWLERSFWALSNLCASPPFKNGENPILEKFVQISKEEFCKGQSALDQVLQFCFLIHQKIQNQVILIEASIALFNYASCCTDAQFEQCDLKMILEFITTVPLQKIDLHISMRHGVTMIGLMLEVIVRLFRAEVESKGHANIEEFYEMFEQCQGVDQLIKLREHPKATQSIVEQAHAILTEFFTAHDNNTDLAEQDRHTQVEDRSEDRYADYDDDGPTYLD